MKKISISEALSSKNWYGCECEMYEEQIHFRLRVLNFRKTSIQEITPDSEEQAEGALWIMGIEFVNLNKRPIKASTVRASFEVEDHEGFVFETFTGDKLDLDKKSGLHRFSGWSSNPSLAPKIKASGAILFELPEEEAQYSLLIKNGRLIAL